MPTTHTDVLIVGAGISGIGAACHLTRDCPGVSYRILERRAAIGGTWDLFRYPGIRSDSDMYTFGFNFRPWPGTKVLADGPSIRQYVHDTAEEYGVTEHITFGRKVITGSWSSTDARWTLTTEDEASGETETYTADFLIGATGYYNYDQGYRPQFPGEEQFTGTLVHPQHWPEDLDYAGKNVVVIGSGATAITLVPAMAEQTAHITMLQRSPTYVVSVPAVDAIAQATNKVLPPMLAYRASRLRNIAIQRTIYGLARSQPRLMKKLITGAAAKQTGGATDAANFTPVYDPWDQRLCVVPDGDLFASIRKGKASVVTGTIDTFTETGIRLVDGQELPADIIVTATGLDVQMFGGGQLDVDGTPVQLRDIVTYKSVLLEGVPNAAMIFGYTNASWTLKADLAAEFVCRIINRMRGTGKKIVVATAQDSDRGTESVLASLNSGYVRRGADRIPRQGTRAPWTVLNNYFVDAVRLRRQPIEDGVLQFRDPEPAPATEAVGASA